MAASRSAAVPVPLFLAGARVTAGFRAALFDAANREGVSINEFCIHAAAERLKAHGADFPGVFRRGDMQIRQEA